jgi:hypothetical protein
MAITTREMKTTSQRKARGKKGAGWFTAASPEKEECVYVYDGRSR